MAERPADYPKLKDYVPSRFMLPENHYDEQKADRAVRFIENLCHTKGKWAGKHFWLLPWQEQLIRDIFGIVKPDGNRQFRTAFIEIPKKNGKQLAIDTEIPTPEGWSTMGSLQVGDFVLSENGQPCQVVAKSEVDTTEDGYRITFRDGSSIVAGARHQWRVDYINGKTKHDIVMTSEEIYKKWSLPSCNERGVHGSPVRIRVNKCLDLPEADLPLDPYTFGIWLGDGTATKKEICAFEDDMQYIFGAIPYTPTAIYQNGEGRSWRADYKELECVRLKNWRDKRIPESYLRASEEQRWNLLAGLVDSDGHVSSIKGQAVITGVLKPLMEDVRELLWSLGIKNSMTETPSLYHGEPTGETMYIIRFVAFDDMPLSKIPRYLERRVPRKGDTRNAFHYIQNIENIGSGIPMQCIQVDSESHCYLAGRSMVPTHNSELAAAVALYLLYADNEPSAEVYGAAADRQQASIVFDVAKRMVEMSPALMKRTKVIDSTKRLVNFSNSGYYQVLSAEVGGKHGFSISGLVFDEIHVQKDRKLYDVLTKGTSDARQNPLHFIITTAGTDRNSVAYELHRKALDVLEGRLCDPVFYPVVYSLGDDEDWEDERNWMKANPSVGYTIDIERMRDAYREAKQSPADEMTFRWLRLNQWMKQEVRWMPMDKWDACNFPVSERELEGRICYGGLDLSSTTDITAFVLVFPPQDEDDRYAVLPYFWIPEDNVPVRVRRDHVPYDVWERQGMIQTTEGDVIHYGYIEDFIEKLGERFNIQEIAFDRWGAVQMVQNLEGMGFTVVPFGQGFKDMSPPTKELMKLVLEQKIAHGGNPVLRWMVDNVVIRTDPAGNIKADKAKSTEKIDGIIATIMGLDRAIRCGNTSTESVYDTRGLLVF